MCVLEDCPDMRMQAKTTIPQWTIHDYIGSLAFIPNAPQRLA